MILVVSGCQEEEDSIQTRLYLNSAKPITVIKTATNKWEYTAFSMIAKYRDDDVYGSKVRSKYYFLIHDTCIVDATFADQLVKNDDFVKNENYGILKPAGVCCSNILLIHQDVLLSFVPNVSHIKTKTDAVKIELGREVEVEEVVTPTETDDVQPSFASFHNNNLKPTYLFKTRLRDKPYEKDLYNTGSVRVCVRYECFGLRKFILHERYGDFDGGRLRNIWTRETV